MLWITEPHRTAGEIIELFADDAQLYFPKWGVAQGREEIQQLLVDISEPIQHIEHHVDDITWILSGTDLLVAEGTSHGQHADGHWQAGNPDWGAGRWCDVLRSETVKSSVYLSILIQTTLDSTKIATPGFLIDNTKTLKRGCK